MKTLFFPLLMCVLLVSGTQPFGFAQENAGAKSLADEVHRLFLADQAAREKFKAHPSASVSEADVKELTDTDKQRRDRMRQIIDAAGLKTGEDYHDAAFIFQHGDAPEDYLLAHILAMAGVAKGNRESRWIAAATLDRYLQSIKQKQVFGTQYFQSGASPYTQDPYDKKLLTEDLRQTFCVKSQAEQEKTVQSLNQHTPLSSADPCASEPGEQEQAQLGSIEFFGYAGLDLGPVRSALPIHVGDSFLTADWPARKAEIERAVAKTVGHGPTDTALVCCNPDGHSYLFIGLEGKSSKPFTYNPRPTGSIRLPQEAIDLYDQAMAALGEAIARGENGEDDSQGYALAADSKERAINLKMREYALHHEDTIRQALKSSSDDKSREVASHLLGYAQQSQSQIDDLIAASRDPNFGVRNNATRALSVLADSSPAAAAKIPASGFVDMLSSGNWTDRNKSIALLTTLTTSRNPQLLAQLRSQAFDALVEMARWRTVYSLGPRVVLARIAGLSDQRTDDLATDDPTERIISTLEKK